MADLVPLGRPKAKQNALGGFGARKGVPSKSKEESQVQEQLPPLQQLGPACERCGVTKELYGSQCGHLTLCQACGKALKLEGVPCKRCGEKLDKLVREYVISSIPHPRAHFIAKYPDGTAGPPLGNRKRWFMQKEAPEGSEAAGKLKGSPWLLGDMSEKNLYRGTLEGGQNSSYMALIMADNKLTTFPIASWYNFRHQVNLKSRTLEEAEEHMKKREQTSTSYQQWMLRTSNSGASAFPTQNGGGVGGGAAGREEGGALSDDDGQDEARRARPKRDEDGDEEAGRGEDWEHDEAFSDDDEAPGTGEADEREEQEQEKKAPPPKEMQEELEGQRSDSDGEAGGDGAQLQRLLKENEGGEEEEDEEDEEDEDEEENEDLLEKIGALGAGAETRSAPSAREASAEPGGGAGPSGRPATAGGKRKEVPGATQAGQKKQKVEATAKPSTAAAAAGPSKPPPPAASKPTGKPANPRMLTVDFLKETLRETGPISLKDLLALLKKRNCNPQTKEEKDNLQAVMKKAVVADKINGVSILRAKG